MHELRARRILKFSDYIEVTEVDMYDRKTDKPWTRLTPRDKVLLIEALNLLSLDTYSVRNLRFFLLLVLPGLLPGDSSTECEFHMKLDDLSKGKSEVYYLAWTQQHASHRVCTDHGKVWKVLEFDVQIFKALKSLENDHRYGKVWKNP